MNEKTVEILITESADDIPSDEVSINEGHKLKIRASSKGDVMFNFTSRAALFDFARSLLHESIFGEDGLMEFYPLGFKGENLAVNGVRLDSESSRLFLTYPSDTEVPPIS